jgi:hypothetical protein
VAGWAAARRKIHVAGAGGVAALGVGVLVSACSPVQMGAAAIVGNQRITQSTLDTQISNFNNAAAAYPGQVQITSAQVPSTTLTWLIRFTIEDRMASEAGVTVSQSDIQSGEAAVAEEIQEEASEEGQSTSLDAGLLNVGIAPAMLANLGKYQAQIDAFAAKANGGKLPSTTAENTAVTTALDKAECTAAKSLAISVNPQYGRFNYSEYEVVSADTANVLSAASGKPTKVSTSGLTPAC